MLNHLSLKETFWTQQKCPNLTRDTTTKKQQTTSKDRKPQPAEQQEQTTHQTINTPHATDTTTQDNIKTNITGRLNSMTTCYYCFKRAYLHTGSSAIIKKKAQALATCRRPSNERK